MSPLPFFKASIFFFAKKYFMSSPDLQIFTGVHECTDDKILSSYSTGPEIKAA